jgi:hypothetical protein
MKTCTPQQYRQYLESFTVPDPADRQLIDNGKVGLILLPESRFRYDPKVGYSFDTAVMVEEGTDRRLLFIRIDSWDPKNRETSAPDYCIPMAYEGASDRERLIWTIGFEGGWSDAKEEVLLVLDSSWREWFRSFSKGLAFSNASAESAAFLKFRHQEFAAIRAFSAGPLTFRRLIAGIASIFEKLLLPSR